MLTAATTPAAAGQVGDQRDLGEPVADPRRRVTEGAQGRAWVEPEPAEPEDQHAEADQGHRVPRDRPRLALGVVLAPPRAEQEQGRERAGGADQVDHRRAGEVLHPDVDLQPAAAEDPVADHRIQHRREDHGVDQVGAELDPLERRAPDDRQGDGAEDELEEQERGWTDRVRLEERDLGRRRLRRRADVEEEPGIAGDQAGAAPGEREPHRPVGERCDREVDEDLRHSGARVLHPREADLEQQEPRLHEHHEHGRDDDPHRVQRDLGVAKPELELVDLVRDGGRGRARERQKREHGDSRRREICSFHLSRPPWGSRIRLAR